MLPNVQTASSAGSASRSLGSVALGAFICFQLINIPLSNYIKMVPVRCPDYHGEINGDLQNRLDDDAAVLEPFQTIADTTAQVLSRWAEVSGQGQCWALFVGFSDRAAFPVVELRWPESAGRTPVRLSCYFEPSDPTNYFYPPEPKCRLWNYEYRMAVFHIIEPRAFPSPQKYREEAIRSVSDMRRSIRAYLQWKSGKYLQDHPELPAVESVTLCARILPDPPVGESHKNRPPAYEVPMARWYPIRPVDRAFTALEAWDPAAGKFVALAPGGVP